MSKDNTNSLTQFCPLCEQAQKRIKELNVFKHNALTEINKRDEKFIELEKKFRELEAENERLLDSVKHFQESAIEARGELERLKQEREDNEYFHAARNANGLIAACRVENQNQLKEITRLKSIVGELREALEQHEKLMSESGGVSGLHLNGNEASWEWLKNNAWLDKHEHALDRAEKEMGR